MSLDSKDLAQFVQAWFDDFMSEWECHELVTDGEKAPHHEALAEVKKRLGIQAEVTRKQIKHEAAVMLQGINDYGDCELQLESLLEDLGHTIIKEERR